jgi:hypothetical protein
MSVTGYTKAQMDTIIASINASEPQTRVRFSTLTGANDDAKLASFISSAGAGVNGYFGQTLVLDEMRTYSFTSQHTIYSGFSIVSAGRSTDQARSGLPIPNKVNLSISGGTGNGGWLVLPSSNVFGVNMAGLSFDGSSTSRVFDPNGSAVLWMSTFRDICMQNIASFMGSSSTQQSIDLSTFGGLWNLNNVRDCAFNIAGSDATFMWERNSVDCPNSLGTASQTLVYFSNSSKATVYNLYITCDQKSGMSVSGNSGQREQRYVGCEFEGRNVGAPCFGAVVRGTGDHSFTFCRFANGMSGGSNGRTDKGLVYQTGGIWHLDHCTFELATGQPTSTVMYAIDAGTARLTNAKTEGLNAPFLPKILAPAGGSTTTAGNMTTYTFTGGSVTFDDTFTM